MKKSLAILLTTIGLTSGVFASPFDGFYVGAAAGAAFTQTKLSGDTSGQYLDFSGTIQQIQDSSPSQLYKNSVLGDIYLGYGHQLGQTPLYLGAEIFGDLANRSMSINQTNAATPVVDVPPPFPPRLFISANLVTNANVKLNSGEFGVDLRPGILFGQNTLLSALVGIAFNKLQISTNSTEIVNYNPIVLPPGTPSTYVSTLNSATSKNVAALQLGGKLEEHFNNHWSLSADYIYTDYGKISINAVGNINTLFTPPNDLYINAFKTNASASLHSNTVMLGLNYYFSGNQEAA